MNEIFKLLHRVTGKKLTRLQQRHWTRIINKIIDDRIQLVQRYSESTDMLGFDEWVQLQEGVNHDG